MLEGAVAEVRDVTQRLYIESIFILLEITHSWLHKLFLQSQGCASKRAQRVQHRPLPNTRLSKFCSFQIAQRRHRHVIGNSKRSKFDVQHQIVSNPTL